MWFGAQGGPGDTQKGEIPDSYGLPPFCEDGAVARIDRESTLHVAGLARLALTDDEVERFEGQLEDILAAVDKVSELDLADVEPTSHPLDLVNVWADDVPRPCLDREDALANAPEREDGFFKVPPPG
jgi:aspartyl-tRNA(Asn)/glutamyl-tRNA(Gln) amidotransferase subunit C